jgi:hypothetical protein
MEQEAERLTAGYLLSRCAAELTRWDRERAAEVDNLVLLTRDEADTHDQVLSLQALAAAEPAFCAKVERLLRRARREHGLHGDRSY